MNRLTVGAKAPEFSLLNQAEQKVSLAEFTGKKVLVYFYPKALTPGCTTQACGLRDSQSELKALNVEVLKNPEFNGGTVAIDSPINKEDKYSEVQSPKVTKRLANTGETDTNVGLTGVGLAIAGSLLIFGKRRKKDEE